MLTTGGISREQRSDERILTCSNSLRGIMWDITVSMSTLNEGWDWELKRVLTSSSVNWLKKLLKHLMCNICVNTCDPVIILNVFKNNLISIFVSSSLTELQNTLNLLRSRGIGRFQDRARARATFVLFFVSTWWEQMKIWPALRIHTRKLDKWGQSPEIDGFVWTEALENSENTGDNKK